MPVHKKKALLPVYVKQTGPATWTMAVWALPRAKQTAVDGLHENRLKIRLAAKAVENKANVALVFFVARALGLKKNAVTLIAGSRSRAKILEIQCEDVPCWSVFL